MEHTNCLRWLSTIRWERQSLVKLFCCMWLEDDGYIRIAGMYVLCVLDKVLSHWCRVVFLCQEDISRWLWPVEPKQVVVIEF